MVDEQQPGGASQSAPTPPAPYTPPTAYTPPSSPAPSFTPPPAPPRAERSSGVGRVLPTLLAAAMLGVAGFFAGQANGDASGYARGNDEGYAKGVTDGDAAGHARGLSEGDAAGYARGSDEGYAKGIAEGTVKGIAQGEKAARKRLAALIPRNVAANAVLLTVERSNKASANELAASLTAIGGTRVAVAKVEGRWYVIIGSDSEEQGAAALDAAIACMGVTTANAVTCP
jgi:hypothetical protein